MTKTKKRILKIICGFLLLTGLTLLIITVKAALSDKEEAWKDFRTSIGTGEAIVDGVIDGNTAYTIISSTGRKDYGDHFGVFKQHEDRWIYSYENDFKDLKPWKIELADVDGDGTTEILTAVIKTTHFDAEEKNRMFIFNYDGEKLVKKWTGSKTAGDWKDFIVGDLLPIKGDELIFIEQSKDGSEHISIYYWFDFGFDLLAESENYKDILNLSIIEENRIQITYDEEHKLVKTLTVKDGKIIELQN